MLASSGLATPPCGVPRVFPLPQIMRLVPSASRFSIGALSPPGGRFCTAKTNSGQTRSPEPATTSYKDSTEAPHAAKLVAHHHGRGKAGDEAYIRRNPFQRDAHGDTLGETDPFEIWIDRGE
jgi:hypothetical protein